MSAPLRLVCFKGNRKLGKKISVGGGLLLLVLALGACQTSPDSDGGTGPDSEAFARQIIIEKVDAAVEAQRELAAATVEGQQQILRRQAALDVDEVDIDYVGKPQPLLESVAYRYGYKYIESGRRGDLKTVNMRVRKRSVPEVLRDIGLQVGDGAEIVLDRDSKILRLVYKRG